MACTTCPSTLDDIVIVAFSISHPFTSIHPLLIGMQDQL
jgi:hypothetical protein